MSVYTHITVGTNNMAKAREFYDKVLAPLGMKRIYDNEDKASGWGVDGPVFFVFKPADGKPATVGNGVTVSFAAPDRAAVAGFHKAAMGLGAKDEGPVGPRSWVPTAYAGYCRDLDGNKICAYSFTDE